MKTYHVTWDIDIEADGPREAAKQALKIQRDPDSIATVFTVYDEHDSYHVDLEEEPE